MWTKTFSGTNYISYILNRKTLFCNDLEVKEKGGKSIKIIFDNVLEITCGSRFRSTVDIAVSSSAISL